MTEEQISSGHAPPALSLEELKTLHHLCREGRLYEVEHWISSGRALQLDPAPIPK
jgi:hypothetical protein